MSDSESLQRIGRYLVEGELGKGAMGVVYRARDERIDRPVALKTLHAVPGVDETMAQEIKSRFLNEAKAAGRLNHPNIVTVFDADEDEASGVTYLAMELVEGVELKTMIAEGQLTGEKTHAILTDVASALDHAHERGVIHRDVKPANIMVDRDGRAQLADFGIARLASSTMTQAGALLGSPAYMSPEQIRGLPVTPASDVFSLAVILYECLTGNRPFGGANMITTTQSIVSDEPPPPSTVRTSLDPLVDAVLARGLAKSSTARFETASAMMKAVGDALAGRPMEDQELPTVALPPGSLDVSAAAPVTPEPAASGGGKRGLIGLVLILAVAAACYAAWTKLGRGTGEPEQASLEGVTPASEPRPAPEPVEQVPVEVDQDPIQPVVTDAGANGTELPPANSEALFGTLSVDLSTFSSGRLIVTDDLSGETILDRTVSSLKRRRGFKIKNPKRHFQLEAKLPAGRHTFRFTFKVRDGKTLSKRAVKDIESGQTLLVEVDVGTLGRDLDVEFP